MSANAPETRGKPSRVLLYALLAFVVFWFGYLTFFGPKAAGAA